MAQQKRDMKIEMTSGAGTAAGAVGGGSAHAGTAEEAGTLVL
jgi:hypothetical protein